MKFINPFKSLYAYIGGVSFVILFFIGTFIFQHTFLYDVLGFILKPLFMFLGLFCSGWGCLGIMLIGGFIGIFIIGFIIGWLIQMFFKK